MKILLTGSSGFIGTHLKDHLLNSHEVIRYDLTDNQDIRNLVLLDKTFEVNKPDVVIHCAALTGVRRSEEYPDEYISTNIGGTLNVANMCEKHRVKQLINFSSSSVYGSTKNEATPEHAPKQPKSIYGITKLAAELIAERAGSEHLAVAIIRPFTVYGERGRGDQVIQKWIDQIKKGEAITFYGDGTSSRGYTYVKDLIDGIDKVIEQRAEGVFNLGGDTAVTLKNLRKIFENEIETTRVHVLPVQPGDQPHSLADTLKAQRVLGWKPKTVFSKKVKEIIRESL